VKNEETPETLILGIGFGCNDGLANDVHKLGAFINERAELGDREQLRFDAEAQPNPGFAQLLEDD